MPVKSDPHQEAWAFILGGICFLAVIVGMHILPALVGLWAPLAIIAALAALVTLALAALGVAGAMLRWLLRWL